MNVRSKPSDDVEHELRVLLRKHLTEAYVVNTMLSLSMVIEDPNDGHELVRLMQKWGACV